jgi:hypothetical protein
MPVREAIRLAFPHARVFSDPRSSSFIGGHTVLLGFFGWLDDRITTKTKNIWPPITPMNADKTSTDLDAAH